MMTESNAQPLLLGIDVGGTFTDFVALRDGEIQVHKVPTTSDDQSRAIVAGLADLPAERAGIIHGMTVATNALLERRGAKTALLTTKGFADTLVIGRQNRPHLYHLIQQRPQPLVSDEYRLEVSERIAHDGTELTPLDEEEVVSMAKELQAQDVESLAIVFLFSFRAPEHELRAAKLIGDHFPALPISISSAILPEYREYERMSTTVINAYVQPLVARYLQRLDSALAGSHIHIMQSNGGAIGLKQAADQAARVVLSGPAGGVVGAFAVGRQAMDQPDPQLITFDMGGTSTDVALCPGQIPTTSESTIGDLPLRLPVIDIHTVGAGGGSIAYVDAGGGLRVGPRSAGAQPGPVCYGRGGTEPTVTDANLVLGRLDPQAFLGGESDLCLDRDAANESLMRLGESIGLNTIETALGVIRIANAVMERALRRVSVERGHDPRHFVLLPFGGAGPLHACELAAALGIERILIPPIPGVLSAYGMLVADITYDRSQTILQPAASLLQNIEALQRSLAALQQHVERVLQSDGVAAPHMEAALDMRYQGQSYELTVPLELPITVPNLDAAIAAFHGHHAQRYGYATAQEPVEIVNLRVRGTGPGAQAALPAASLSGTDAQDAHQDERQIWFNTSGPTAVACYSRPLLQPGNRFSGPALITQFDSTTVIAPGWQASVDRYRNIWVEANR